MPIVTHPTIPTMTFRVPSAALSGWVAAGWIAPSRDSRTPEVIVPGPTDEPETPAVITSGGQPVRSTKEK